MAFSFWSLMSEFSSVAEELRTSKREMAVATRGSDDFLFSGRIVPRGGGGGCSYDYLSGSGCGIDLKSFFLKKRWIGFR